MVKIGLVGCGMWGRNLARNLAQLDVLAAVADRTDENAAAFAAQFNSRKSDWDAMLAPCAGYPRTFLLHIRISFCGRIIVSGRRCEPLCHQTRGPFIVAKK